MNTRLLGRFAVQGSAGSRDSLVMIQTDKQTEINFYLIFFFKFIKGHFSKLVIFLGAKHLNFLALSKSNRGLFLR